MAVVNYHLDIIMRNVSYTGSVENTIEYVKKTGVLLKFMDIYYIAVTGKEAHAAETILAVISDNGKLLELSLAVYLYDPHINLNILVSKTDTQSSSDYPSIDTVGINLSESKYLDLTDKSLMKYPNKKMKYNILVRDNTDPMRSVLFNETNMIYNKDLFMMSVHQFTPETHMQCDYLGGIVFNKSNKIIGICVSDQTKIYVVPGFRVATILNSLSKKHPITYSGPGCLPIILDNKNGKVRESAAITTSTGSVIQFSQSIIVKKFNGEDITYGMVPSIMDSVTKKKIPFSAYLENNFVSGDNVTLTYVEKSQEKTIEINLLPYDNFFLKMTANTYVWPRKGIPCTDINGMLITELTRSVALILDELNVKISNKKMMLLFSSIKRDFTYNIDESIIVIDSTVSNTKTNFGELPILKKESTLQIPFFVPGLNNKHKLLFNWK